MDLMITAGVLAEWDVNSVPPLTSADWGMRSRIQYSADAGSRLAFTGGIERCCLAKWASLYEASENFSTPICRALEVPEASMCATQMLAEMLNGEQFAEAGENDQTLVAPRQGKL